MKTLMTLASIMMIAAGTFCIANSTVAFISVAFVVGIAMMLLGICEVIVSCAHILTADNDEETVRVEGITSIVLASVFLSGQLSDNVVVNVVIALWVITDALKSVSNFSVSDIRFNGRELFSFRNINTVLGVVLLIYGLYMFFNDRVFNFPLVGMIGGAILLVGIRRVKVAADISYKRPSVIATGSMERLNQAKRAEKLAMKKAKDGIRETKIAQQRIEEINRQMEKEQALKREAEEVKRELKAERKR